MPVGKRYKPLLHVFESPRFFLICGQEDALREAGKAL